MYSPCFGNGGPTRRLTVTFRVGRLHLYGPIILRHESSEMGLFGVMAMHSDQLSFSLVISGSSRHFPGLWKNMTQVSPAWNTVATEIAPASVPASSMVSSTTSAS